MPKVATEVAKMGSGFVVEVEGLRPYPLPGGLDGKTLVAGYECSLRGCESKFACSLKRQNFDLGNV